MKNGTSSKPSSRKHTSKVNNKGIYVCPRTFRSSPTAKEGYDYFASQLELSTFLILKQLGVSFIKQYPVQLLPDPDSVIWKCDFYIPGKNLIVECKGSWLQESHSSADKALFLLQINLARRAGYELILIDRKPWNLNKKTKVHSITEIAQWVR